MDAATPATLKLTDVDGATATASMSMSPLLMTVSRPVPAAMPLELAAACVPPSQTLLPAADTPNLVPAALIALASANEFAVISPLLST